MLHILGLIGGIGSGKSTVAGLFVEKGAYLIQGDQLGHEGLQQAEIREAAVARWGDEVLQETGEIDRRKLGAIVFAYQGERRALEQLLFPFIERRIQEEIEKARHAQVQVVVLDAAVMLEAGWDRFCDKVIFVDVPREKRLERLKNKRGWSEQELSSRERAQISLEKKESRADAVIDNSGDLEQTRTQVDKVVASLREATAETGFHV